MCMRGPSHIYVPVYLVNNNENTTAENMQILDATTTPPQNILTEEDLESISTISTNGAQDLQDIEKLNLQQYYRDIDNSGESDNHGCSEKGFLLPPPVTSSSTAASSGRRKKGYLMIMGYLCLLLVVVMVMGKSVTPFRKHASLKHGAWPKEIYHKQNHPQGDKNHDSHGWVKGMKFKPMKMKMPCHGGKH